LEQQLRDKEEELKKKDEQILHLQSLLNMPEDKRMKLEEKKMGINNHQEHDSHPQLAYDMTAIVRAQVCFHSFHILKSIRELQGDGL
jgi:hypothetical protein